MKTFSLLALLIASSVSAHTITLSDYNYSLRDIREQNLNKESLFKNMNRTLVRWKDSICSNRAHVWAYDFKMHNIDGAKVFMFFTPKTGSFNGIAWWYHVSPVINEGGKLFVMDAGFPHNPHQILRPLTVQEWLKEFNGKDSTCKEITNADADLLSLIFKESALPETTAHGTYNCYYKLVPPGYWTPGQVAENALGKNAEGEAVRFDRDEFNEGEVYSACKEAATDMLGYMFSSRKCRRFVANGSQSLISE